LFSTTPITLPPTPFTWSMARATEGLVATSAARTSTTLSTSEASTGVSGIARSGGESIRTHS
jgi:hypothetical protein